MLFLPPARFRVGAYRLPLLFFAVFALFQAGLYAQPRSNARIFVPRPVGGIPYQQVFFQDQFQEELKGAGYIVAETREESDYTLQMTIQTDTRFDGAGGPGGTDRFTLLVRLLTSKSNIELVRFEFPFTNMEEMTGWNLFLLYRAMARIPGGALPEDIAEEAAPFPPFPVTDNSWRRKRLYLNFGLGADMAYFMQPGSTMASQGMVMPAILIGAEFHPLDFFSVEADPVKLRFLHDGDRYFATAGFALLCKGVFKPGDYAMLEPYAGAEFSIPLRAGTEIPWLSALGGMQFGFRGGRREAYTIDFSVTYSLAGRLKLVTETTNGTLKFGLLFGYKVGFFDR